MLVVGGLASHADAECRVVEADFVPAAELQIVAWIEDTAGTYVDTAFITQATGLRGIGNRPGVMGIKSGPLWPYGRRLDVFPIWSHRHGESFPAVVYQRNLEGDPALDLNIDTLASHSSSEDYFCRPMQPVEPGFDAMTCASAQVYTDKGRLSQTATSAYPPRADHTRRQGDGEDVDAFAALNAFDAIAQATPRGELPFRLAWRVPVEVPPGDYVLRVEVSKERDFNASYPEERFPPPQMPWLDFGVPYRGQPSVVYDVPFTLGAVDTEARTDAYAGYGDVEGLDGSLRAPDVTISDGVPGSGASRLALVADEGTPYRVRVVARPGDDQGHPGAIAQLAASEVEAEAVTLTFTAPGDDGDAGTVTAYEIRYRAGVLDEADFATGTPFAGEVIPVAAGGLQEVRIEGLSPRTPYTFAIRALDECLQAGPIALVAVDTTSFAGEVGACGGCTSGTSGGLAMVGVLGALSRRRRRR